MGEDFSLRLLGMDVNVQDVYLFTHIGLGSGLLCAKGEKKFSSF